MTARDRDIPIPVGNVQPNYLGDGAYVSRDSFQIWVSADRDGQLHAVALDALAIQSLVAYAKRVGLMK